MKVPKPPRGYRLVTRGLPREDDLVMGPLAPRRWRKCYGLRTWPRIGVEHHRDAEVYFARPVPAARAKGRSRHE